MEKKSISKREFLKLGVCGLGCATLAPSALANDFLPASSNSTKHRKEAQFYTITPRGVRCEICPNECTLKINELSDCRNRINKDGKLYSIAYGNPCAVHVDPIEKKPLLHFLPASKAFSIATAGCNLACLNCQNWTISQTTPTKTNNFDLMPDKVVRKAIETGSKSIAYTYSEPITFYEYTHDTAYLARQSGIKNVLVSAGYINEKPLHKLAKYIDAANIDLKSFSNDIYLKLNAGTLQPILNTLNILNEEKVWLEITNLLVPGWTDDFEMIKRMCNWLAENGFQNTPLHFSRFHPQYKLTQLPPTPVSTLTKAREIAKAEGLNYIYIGNVPGLNMEDTYCPSCKKKVIERKGYRIIDNQVKDGKCGHCQKTIHGVWQ